MSAVFVPIAIALAFGITMLSKTYLRKKLSGEDSTKQQPPVQ
jgi:hypothetical protein